MTARIYDLRKSVTETIRATRNRLELMTIEIQ